MGAGERCNRVFGGKAMNNKTPGINAERVHKKLDQLNRSIHFWEDYHSVLDGHLTDYQRNKIWADALEWVLKTDPPPIPKKEIPPSIKTYYGSVMKSGWCKGEVCPIHGSDNMAVVTRCNKDLDDILCKYTDENCVFKYDIMINLDYFRDKYLDEIIPMGAFE